jgi:hypothetical protein
MSVLDESELKAARARHLDGVLREIKLFSRRADQPEDRAALAELERELLTIETRWRKAGLIEPELIEA